MKVDLFIEHSGVQTDSKILTDTVKEVWKEKGFRVKDLNTVELFYKPEEKKCYYVLNGDEKGVFEV